MDIIQVKPSLIKILHALGLESIDDFNTILPPDTFHNLDISLVVDALKDHNLHFITSDQVNTNEELIFENVNRLLELRYGRVIDSLKEVDQLGEGYKIEMMQGNGC